MLYIALPVESLSFSIVIPVIVHIWIEQTCDETSKGFLDILHVSIEIQKITFTC